jgi:hypothetical protein
VGSEQEGGLGTVPRHHTHPPPGQPNSVGGIGVATAVHMRGAALPVAQVCVTRTGAVQFTIGLPGLCSSPSAPGALQFTIGSREFAVHHRPPGQGPS